MRFICGTGNPAKLQLMQEMLAPLPVEIIGITSVFPQLLPVDESGNDPLENAVIKALAYYDLLQAPVFSCDSGLYLEGLDQALQPGVHVRNVGGKSLTDDEMIVYYASLATQCGGVCRGIYRNAICLVYDNRHIFKYMGEDISGERFLLSSVPHPKRSPGFPLDSLCLHIDSGKYYFDLDEKYTSTPGPGFCNFFQRVMRALG